MGSKGYGQTHVGMKRKNNQDSILVDEALGLYAVADGMGGHLGGEVASAMAIEALQSFVSEAAKGDKFSPAEVIEEAFIEANRQVFQKSRDSEAELAGMGTTLVACLIWKGRAFFGNVGDSRGYLFRDPYLWRATDDHSVLNNEIKKGLVDAEQAALLVRANVITRSIGFVEGVEVDVFKRDICPEDKFLLCSDGLTEMVSDGDICALASRHSIEDLPARCVEKALEAGGNDNVSVVSVSP